MSPRSSSPRSQLARSRVAAIFRSNAVAAIARRTVATRRPGASLHKPVAKAEKFPLYYLKQAA